MERVLKIVLLILAVWNANGHTIPIPRFPFNTAQVSALCAAEAYKGATTCRYTSGNTKYVILSCGGSDCDSSTLGDHYIGSGISGKIYGLCPMSDVKYTLIKCGKHKVKTAYIEFVENSTKCKNAVKDTILYKGGFNYPTCKPFPTVKPTRKPAKKPTKKLTKRPTKHTRRS